MKPTLQYNRYQAGLMVLILLAASLSGASAQTVLDSGHQWVSVQHIDRYSGQTLNDTIRVTLSTSELTLGYRNIERTFPVSNITGTWSNLALAGEITFNIQVLDLAGNAQLRREDGQLTLLIDLSERKDWMNRKFTLIDPL